ncbi:DUF1742-domain-containing protein [Lentinula aff. lateritia]|uniref:DUF1742-domain-containing protein n=1 Tax=Lentinula aff. lateritia TaxID=2804960 RepID=A0ACC1TZR6_9AGAR|nr:DUF1742-domain-containing protein [Lentinula aff. lateritia]
MSFANLYYKRNAGTPKACWVCFKPTTTVLATINTVDFLYTCDSHLTDRGFASESSGGAGKLDIRPEEIAKVKEEWEEKQKQKQKADKEKEEEKQKTEESNKKNDEKQKDEGTSKSPSPKLSGSLSPPATPSPSATHRRFILHRDIFTMRLAEHRKRRQTTQAKELAPRLPGAPRGDVI